MAAAGRAIEAIGAIGAIGGKLGVDTAEAARGIVRIAYGNLHIQLQG